MSSKVINLDEVKPNLEKEILLKKIAEGVCIIPGCTNKSGSGNLCDECDDPLNPRKQQKTKIILKVSYDDSEIDCELILPTDIVYEKRIREANEYLKKNAHHHYQENTFVEVEVDYCDLDEMITAQSILRESIPDKKSSGGIISNFIEVGMSEKEDSRLGAVIMTGIIPSLIAKTIIELLKDKKIPLK